MASTFGPNSTHNSPQSCVNFSELQEHHGNSFVTLTPSLNLNRREIKHLRLLLAPTRISHSLLPIHQPILRQAAKPRHGSRSGLYCMLSATWICIALHASKQLYISQYVDTAFPLLSSPVLLLCRLGQSSDVCTWHPTLHFQLAVLRPDVLPLKFL